LLPKLEQQRGNLRRNRIANGLLRKITSRFEENRPCIIIREIEVVRLILLREYLRLQLRERRFLTRRAIRNDVVHVQLLLTSQVIIFPDSQAVWILLLLYNTLIDRNCIVFGNLTELCISVCRSSVNVISKTPHLKPQKRRLLIWSPRRFSSNLNFGEERNS
jgi:hypothetical protein